MELMKIQIDDFGGSPVATHNYPCPVYPNIPAVFHMNTGIFHPSWPAQKEGWRLIKVNRIQLFICWLIGALK